MVRQYHQLNGHEFEETPGAQKIRHNLATEEQQIRIQLLIEPVEEMTPRLEFVLWTTHYMLNSKISICIFSGCFIRKLCTGEWLWLSSCFACGKSYLRRWNNY